MPEEATKRSKKRRLRPWWLRVLLIYILLPYLGVGAMLVMMQRSILYQPTQVARVSPADSGFAEHEVEAVSVTAADGLTLNGWHVRASVGADEDVGERLCTLIFCGNAGNRSHRGPILRLFGDLGVDCYIFDYRGYGENDGSPSETGILEDARTIWRFLVGEREIDPERILLYGESLGGSVATHLAAHACENGQQPGGLLVRSTFSSMVDAGSYHYPWLPVRLVLLDRFESQNVIGQVNCAYLHLHGDSDNIVPHELGRKLFDRAPAESANGVAKQFVTLQGFGHNNVNHGHGSSFAEAIREFVVRHRSTGQK